MFNPAQLEGPFFLNQDMKCDPSLCRCGPDGDFGTGDPEHFLCDGLHEPPKLHIRDQIQLSHALQQKDQLEFNVLDFERRLERLQESLNQIKSEINMTIMEQGILQNSLESSQDEAEVGRISTKKVETHKKLISLIETEDSLLRELEATRKLLSYANIDRQSYQLEMNEKIDEIYRIHTIRKDFEYNCRLEREKAINRNAAAARQREILQCTASYEKYYNENVVSPRPEPKLPKAAVEKLRLFRKVTLGRIARSKSLAAAEEEARQTKQLNNLLKLKRELDEQRELLIAANKLRQERRKEEERAIAMSRENVIAAGGNPFMIERLAEKERMERLITRKEQELQDSTMRHLALEYRKEEQSEDYRARLRQELDELWEAKAKEKRLLARRLEKSYFQGFQNGTRLSPDQVSNFDENATKILSLGLFLGGKNLPNRDPMGEQVVKNEDNRNETEQAEVLSSPVREVTGAGGLSAFKVSPPEVIFKDYDLGKSYKRKVTVSNRSNQRLRFFLREFMDLSPKECVTGSPEAGRKPALATDTEDSVPEELPPIITPKMPITDVVKVSFDVPLPIFPGLSHEFSLTFTPKTFDSWDGELLFDSPAGQFGVPVKCSQKRFLPELSTGLVQFSNVISGTAAFMKVKLVNKGFLHGTITSLRPLVESKSIKDPKMGGANKLKSPPNPQQPLNASHSEFYDSKVNESETGIPRQSPGDIGVDSKVKRKKGKSTVMKPGSTPSEDLITRKRSRSERKRKQRKSKGSISKVRMEEAQEETLEPADELEENPDIPGPTYFDLSIEESTNRLAGNGELTLKVTFSPLAPGEYLLPYEIEFDDPDAPILKLHLEGTAIENPFVATPLNTNLNICITNMSYQQPIEIRNLSKGSGKIVPKVPSILKPFVEVAPKSVRSLPGTPNLFTVKFKPKFELFEQRNIKQFYDEESRILDFPIPFNFEGFPFGIPGPLTCTFQAILDDPELRVEPTHIDCGLCSTAETVQKKLTIQNMSLAPEHFGFVDLPDWISVQPNYGFGTLLPGEVRTVDLLVSPKPSIVGKHQVPIKLQILEKKEYVVHVKALGKLPLTAFTYSHISFPVTCIGSSSSVVTEIYMKGTQSSKPPRGINFTGTTRSHRPNLPPPVGPKTTFEFLIHESFPLEICPSSGKIEPGRGQKVVVTFLADLSEAEVKAHFPVLLQRKFDENLENIRLELTALTDLLGPFGPRKKVKDGKEGGGGDRKVLKNLQKSEKKGTKPSSNGDSKGKDGGGSSSGFKNGSKPSGLAKKLLKSKLLKLSRKELLELEKSKGPPVIRNLQDLQLINSNGTVLIPTNRPKELESRRVFLMKALEYVLSPQELVESPDPNMKLDYFKTRRDLIQTFDTKSRSFTVPCRMSLPDGKEEILQLTLKCPIQKPDLVILDESPVLTFGGVPVGSKAINEVNLYNTSIGALDLRMDSINPYGPFTRVNALRLLAPNLVFTLRIKFSPLEEGSFEETVKIFGGESGIVLTLKGQGLPPEPIPGSKS